MSPTQMRLWDQLFEERMTPGFYCKNILYYVSIKYLEDFRTKCIEAPGNFVIRLRAGRPGFNSRQGQWRDSRRRRRRNLLAADSQSVSQSVRPSWLRALLRSHGNVL